MHVAPLIYFANERERIRQKRAAGAPRPWTKDRVLDTYKFCNVFRRHDRMSRWLIRNWLEPNTRDPELWFACVLARLFNYPETLEAVGYPASWDPRAIQHILEERQNSGLKVFSDAYIIAPGPEGIGKISWVIWNVLDKVHKDPSNARPRPNDTLESAHRRLRWFNGFGDFMAMEVVLDWRETHYLNRAKDLLTWCAAGPGAIRGLNRIYERPVDAGVRQGQALREMRELADILNIKLGDHVQRPLELADVEGLLCETDKYLRIIDGNHSRQRFEPSKTPLP